MKKNHSFIIKSLLTIVILILVALGILIYLNQQPVTAEIARTQFEKMFTLKKEPSNYTGVQVLVHSDKTSFDYRFASGTASGKPLAEEQPYHIASVGKLFTAVLIYQAAQENTIDLNAPLITYLDPALLEGLFVYEGKDYKNQVTTLQLLQHTSGVADYFGGPVLKGKNFTDLMLEDTTRLWTPLELVDFSKIHQVAVGKPGTTYNYSDTGYILLGLLLEKVEGQSFNTLLKTKLFEPLNLTHTYLLFDEKNQMQGNHDMADIWLKGVNLTYTNTLSADWSGGGIISTPSDLLKFSQALHGGKLIQAPYYEAMFQSDHLFNTGIYYGAGGMTIHFEEFFFLLKSLPQIKGHIGILSTHLFYDKDSDTHYILNYGSDAKMEDSFKDLIQVMMTLPKIQLE